MSSLSFFYKSYMRSDKWKLKRLQVFKRDNCLCQSCLSSPATQVHHLTYVHFADEPLFDLVSVCTPCHNRLTKQSHKRLKLKNIDSIIEKELLYYFNDEFNDSHS